MITKCPICKYKGDFFLFRKKDHHHSSNAWDCPECHSKPQHRLIYLIWDRIKDNFTHKKVLHISPMKCLKPLWDKEDVYISIDLPPRETEAVAMAELKQNIKHTCFMDEYFELIVCSHILDMIQDYREAIYEIDRILELMGKVIMVVPIFGEKTEMAKKGSKWSKKWKFGLDFKKELEKYFDVETYTSKDFKDSDKYLMEDEVIYICTKL